MKFSTLPKLAAIGGIAALTLTSCAANESGSASDDSGSTSKLSGELNGAGASSQESAQAAWRTGFQTTNADVTINYDPSGSGAGRESFQQGAVAFAGSDAAFTTDELTGEFAGCAADSGIVEVPAYISPIALAFNVKGVDELNLDAETTAKIFAGEITQWNDPAIAALNKDADLPDQKIVAVHRSDKSGTTGNFTDYLAANEADIWTPGSVEEWPTEFGGEAAQGTSGVVEAIKNGVGTIGYADSSKVEDLSTAKIKVGDEFVAHSAEGAAALFDHSKLESGRGDNDLAYQLDRTTTAKGAYPIVLASYLIGCEKYADAANAELVKSYFEYVISEEGQESAAKEAGSAPISDDLRTKAEAAIESIG